MNKIEKDDLLILVHGTWAKANEGWTSKEHYFHLHLNREFHRLTGKKLYIIPFGWSGLNSLYERQSAATNLIDVINDIHKDHKRIHLLGHSHGGTVIQYALMQTPILTSQKWKSKLSSWTTIGTPFYRFNGCFKITTEFLGLFTVPTALIITYFVVQAVNHFFQMDYKIIYFLLYLLVYAKVDNFFRAKSFQFRLNRAMTNYKEKWFGVYSKYDEAIEGLKNTNAFNLSNEKRVKPSFDSEHNAVAYLGKLFNRFTYNYFTRILINPRITEKVKNSAYGIDKSFYKLKEVSETPLENYEFDPMPEFVDEQIIDYVAKDNQSKLLSLRKLITFSDLNIVERYKQLPESERPLLVHSIYFENLNIIKAIAKHIAHKNELFRK